MTDATITLADSKIEMPNRLRLALRYVRRNKSLAIGLTILILLIAFTLVGFAVVNPKHAYPLSAVPKQPPSFKYPLGTDFFGRNSLIEFFRLASRHRQRFPLLGLQVLRQEHDLAAVIGVMCDLTIDGLHHRVRLSANHDCAVNIRI